MDPRDFELPNVLRERAFFDTISVRDHFNFQHDSHSSQFE